METVYIPTENDFKKWIKDAVEEYFHGGFPHPNTNGHEEQCLLNRKEIAAFLRVSLVTLTDWMKRGLPSHHQRGRVYFDKKEVLNYIKEKKIRQFKIGSKLYHLKTQIDTFEKA